MAVDKLVDSAELDAALNYEASKIIAKGGGTAPLAFDLANGKGFGDYVDAIPSGGGTDTLAASQMGTLDYYESATITELMNTAFGSNATAPKELRLPECTKINSNAFLYSSSLQKFFAPKAGMYGVSCFKGASKLQIAVLCGYAESSISANKDLFMRYGTPHLLETVDFVAKNYGFPGRTFYQCDNLTTLILREAAIFPLGNVNAFAQTPFDTGGAGGTIYIPKTLYDHLGDGTANDYKAATNWSTVNGYGTITWAKIEGSIYENAYADGTPIS